MASDQLDPLTPVARDVLQLDNAGRYEALVPTTAYEQARSQLVQLDADGAVQPPTDRDAEACVRAGLWLWHDFLVESHTISQSVDTPFGSYWLGIMHRREGDFGNAKYWFRLAGELPIFKTLSSHAADVLRNEPADKRLLPLSSSSWNPSALVDLAQTAHREGADSPLHRPAVALQQAEWRVLFDWCVRQSRS
ncbi:MAG: hypothetical protein AAGI46_16420 [Planctomycetota bacterium]